MSKEPTIHWGGGAIFLSGRNGRSITTMGRGYPCCCSGDRAVRIRDSGWIRFREEDASHVNCKRCLEVMAKRLDPGPNHWARIAALPGRPTVTDATKPKAPGKADGVKP